MPTPDGEDTRAGKGLVRSGRQEHAAHEPLIFALLYVTFGSVSLPLLIYLNVPIAATGGIFALWLRGMPFSISAGVGFIALFGIAVMNGVVLVEHIRHLRHSGSDQRTAVFQGSLDRLRPVLMTALCGALGFVPMAVSGSGPRSSGLWPRS